MEDFRCTRKFVEGLDKKVQYVKAMQEFQDACGDVDEAAWDCADRFEEYIAKQQQQQQLHQTQKQRIEAEAEEMRKHIQNLDDDYKKNQESYERKNAAIPVYTIDSSSDEEVSAQVVTF